MEELAPGILQVPGLGISNVYLLTSPEGAILIDTGMPGDRKKILAALGKDPALRPAVIFITHGDIDHVGAAMALKTATGAEVWGHTPEEPYFLLKERPPGMKGRMAGLLRGPVQMDRFLNDGERVGSFKVVASPGHTNGHASLFRESDRVLIAGDAIISTKGRPVLSGAGVTQDMAEAKRSFDRLMALSPSLILSGHGEPIHLAQAITPAPR